jgi:excisionase family DNA binding protein
MAKLTIDIPDELAATLRAHPLPLPVDHYCRSALEAAALRDAEQRVRDEALAREIAIEMERRLAGADENELYTVPEVARVLRLSAETVRTLIRDGRLPSTAVGRRRMVSRRTIRRIIDNLPEEDGDLTGALESVRRSRTRLK